MRLVLEEEMRLELIAIIIWTILLLMTSPDHDVNCQQAVKGSDGSSTTSKESSATEATTNQKGGHGGRKSGERRMRRIAMKRAKGASNP